MRKKCEPLSSVAYTHSPIFQITTISRYVEELLPSFARMEIIRPSSEDMDTLVNEIFDKKEFMVTSKPERVLGGYYIRGQNLLSTPDDAKNDELVSRVQEKLAKSSLKDNIEMFWINDPSPPTDEEYELELTDRPLFAVMGKNREEFYDIATTRTKSLVSLSALFSLFLFAFATCDMQPALQDKLEAISAGTLAPESLDIDRIVNNAFLVGSSLLSIQLVHETCHRIVAWKDKVSNGFS